jgi:hypothetical protein
MSSTRAFGLLMSCALAGCADEAPQLTEMVVVVEAGPALRGMADRVDVAAYTGGDPAVASTPASTTRTFMRPAWPLSLTLLASQPQATLSLVVTAYTGVTPLVSRSVSTQFLAERSLLLGVRLDDVCIDDPAYCAGYTGMTCEAVAGVATCVSNAVDARALPDYEGQRYDAAIPVVADAGSDAGPADAGVGGDAAF